MRGSAVLALCKRLVTVAGLLGMPSALAANYEFLAAPETDLNRVYRLDRVSGEIGACQYGRSRLASHFAILRGRVRAPRRRANIL